MVTALSGARILVPLDGSPLAERALPIAEHLAKALGMSLVLARILPLTTWAFAGPSGLVPAEAYQRLVDDEEQQAVDYLNPLAATLREKGIETLISLNRGQPDDCLLDLCPRFGIGLVVMTSHGRTGMARLALGSVADALVRRSAVPVLLIRPLGDMRDIISSLDRAVVALDGSEVAEAVLPLVEELAGRVPREIQLVRVVESRPSVGKPSSEVAQAEHYLEQIKARLLAHMPGRAGCSVSCSVLLGKPADALIQHTQRHDGLLVLATHGSGGPKRWMRGSVAEALVRGAPTALLLLRPEGAIENPRTTRDQADERDPATGEPPHKLET